METSKETACPICIDEGLPNLFHSVYFHINVIETNRFQRCYLAQIYGDGTHPNDAHTDTSSQQPPTYNT